MTLWMAVVVSAAPGMLLRMTFREALRVIVFLIPVAIFAGAVLVVFDVFGIRTWFGESVVSEFLARVGTN